ncbi:hypothetical protein CRM22_005834 [Opisthorchis felineus]|uniref:C2H2-type domain-containing protein n=1 Tax=Opisthorchis felineus TaxID=147828 RepID=A0A4S2LP79_OPIFE|nr:hypothetical protein CRM22_005834 [Opisthorchis felineus]
MSSEPSTSWLKEVEDYEARMFDYFTQCSTRLKEWYDKGGDESEAYRAEYNRLSAEYQNYINYIQQLRGLSIKATNQSPSPSVEGPQPAATDHLTKMDGNPATAMPVSQPPYNTATAAACYTQYYQEMITYFDKLLTSLEVSHTDEVSPGASAPSTDVNDFGEVLDDAEEERIEDADEFDGDMCCNPQAVMEEYFERFGEIGKWDWASWNNYLSWIARTNPQWYGIFLEYSQSLGIDWDQMYSQWKQSDPLTRQSFDEFADSVDGISIQPPNLTQSVYHGLLFTETADDDDDDGLFCRTCQMRFNTDRAFSIHLRGVTHIQRALENLQRRNPENIDKYTEQYSQFNPDAGGARHYAWLQSQYMEKNKSAFIRPGSLYCELCQVGSSSFASLQAHLSGRRHRENVSQLQSSSGPNLLREKRPSQAKSSARLQTLLDVCTQPLIGLNYIVERQFGDDEECMYYCELCDDRITRQDAINHVCGVAHRTHYMKAHYPDMCGIVASDQSDLDMRLKRIDLFARKIEDFEGRKRVKVKHLSAFDALRRIWRPLDDSDTKTVALMKETTAKVSSQCNNKSKFSVKTIKKKQSKPRDKESSTDDLEEGEITEDSSDEEVTTENQQTTECAAREQATCATDEVEEDLDEDAATDRPKVNILAENLLPRSVSSFRPDSECEVYIESLRTTGQLNLTKSRIEPDSKEASVHSSQDTVNTLEDQFSREADWVLDRVRARQEQEKENHRQLAAAMSAAAADAEALKQQQHPTKPSVLERRMRIQRGLDIVKTSGRPFDSEDLPACLTAPSDFDGFRFPQSDLANGVPPTLEEDIDGVALEEQKFQEEDESDGTQSTAINAQGVGSLSQMDPNRQRLAVSSGAAEIILSALGALRESGQLPNFVNPVILTKPKTDEPTTDVVSVPKVGLLGDALPPSTTPNLLPKGVKPVSHTGPSGFVNRSIDSVPKVEPPQVTSEPSVGLLSSHQHGMPPAAVPMAPPIVLPLSRNSMAPGLLDSEVQHRSSGVGLLGDPLLRPLSGPKSLPQPVSVSKPVTQSLPVSKPMTQSVSVSKQTTQAVSVSVGQSTQTSSISLPQPVPPPKTAPQPVPPPKTVAPVTARGLSRKTGASSSPRSSPKLPSKQPRINSDYSVPPPHPIDEHNLSFKVASYMRADASAPSETMFDAYALYSRRSSERNRPRSPPPMPHNVRSRLIGGRASARNVPRSGAGGGGRKMSVIADLLGVNEPPAPPFSAPKLHSPPVPRTSIPSTSSNITYWRQAPEPSYLVPVATFAVPHSSTLPRISYYIPKQQVGAVPDARSSLHEASEFIPIPPYASPLVAPPAARSFSRPPGNFDDFFRRLQST